MEEGPVSEDVGEPVGSNGAPVSSSSRQVREFYEHLATVVARGRLRPPRTYNFGVLAPRTGPRPQPLPSERRSLGEMLGLLLGDVQPQGRLLEVGCGIGGNLVPLESSAVEVVGIDLVVANLALAKNAFPGPSRFSCGDAQVLPVRSGSIDTLLNVESAGHYPDIEAFFVEVARVLRPGGRFIYADGIVAPFVDAYVLCLEALGFEIEWQEDITDSVLRSFDRQWLSSAAGRRIHSKLLAEPDLLADMYPILLENAWLKYRLEAGLVRYMAIRAQLAPSGVPRRPLGRVLPEAVRNLQPLVDGTAALPRLRTG